MTFPQYFLISSPARAFPEPGNLFSFAMRSRAASAHQSVNPVRASGTNAAWHGFIVMFESMRHGKHRNGQTDGVGPRPGSVLGSVAAA
jgi:hypothetical protein